MRAMSEDLALSVLSPVRDGQGPVVGFGVTDDMIVAVGGLATAPIVVASPTGRDFVERRAPGPQGLTAALAVADAVWVCGTRGLLAVSRDHGGSWKVLDTGTEDDLRGLALGMDGALWVVGDGGFAARVLGPRVRPVDFGTDADLAAVCAVRDEIVALGADGQLRRWRAGAVGAVSCGAARPLAGLAITGEGAWIVVGAGGLVARSPDGQAFAPADAGGVDADLDAVCVLPGGALAAVGDRGVILRSADDGRTWQALPRSLGEGRLRALGRFGEGALIGGDGGLIGRLAPPDDATWSERAEAFEVSPLDDAFSVGPEGFIENGLDVYLEAIAKEGGAGAGEGAGDAAVGAGETAEDAGGDAGGDASGDAGEDVGAFREGHGMPLPPELAVFREMVPARRRRDAFEELRLDAAPWPSAGERNLFELLVLRDQAEPGQTELVDAFCGLVKVGSLGNGDTYHLELYEWEAPRQVLHFDHETRSISKYVADSLDSLVYLTALVRAGDAGRIAPETYQAGLHELHEKVSPTWHLAIEDRDARFVHFEPRRRDSEFFFYRSRWLLALLSPDPTAGLRALPGLFMPDFNKVIAPEQLPARLEACERFIPTALYSLWRAFFFDEPELPRYLEVGRRHAARLVRDAAALIDELLAGRNELGAIRDVRAHLAELRALDLDPRRASARKAEAEARARAEAARKDQVEAELERTPAARWSELGWRWIGDGLAHRALLARLDRAQPHAAQLAALDELRELTDDERAVALPRLAAELSPELEAVLVGSLVRGDQLEGVIFRPDETAVGGAADERAPGWEAIDAALRPIYGAVEPLHYAAPIPYALGGRDPLPGISAYDRNTPVPHWHFVTYGFTDLFHKEGSDPEVSGFGFELTLRLARDPAEEAPPTWALSFLQNLGRYVFGSGNRFAIGHKMGLNGPIALEQDTKITAICFAEDPELGELSSEHGAARFLQVVGITEDEYRLIQEWSTAGLVEILRERLPYLVTDLARPSVLDDPEAAAEIERRVAAEGSSEEVSSAGELRLASAGGRLTIELGALYAAALPRAMRARLRHGRGYELRGRGATLRLEPAERAGYHGGEHELVLELTAELAAEIEARLRGGLAGTYDFGAWLEIVVTPSLIRNQEGQAVDVRGVADPAEARRLIEEENARLAAENREAQGATGQADGAGADADKDADDADEDEDEAPLDAERVAAALGMTRRALRLAPGDADVQLTHALLLLEGERAGVARATDELLERLPGFAPGVRIRVAVQLGEQEHRLFEQVIDIALGEALPDQIFGANTTAMGGAVMMSFGDVAHELFGELGEAILAHAPAKMARLVPLLPDEVDLISELAWKSIEANQRESAISLYDRVLALPIPEDGQERLTYLRAMNNACIQAHAAKAYDAAVRIADRAQPVAHENPHIYHAAACAYAAVGDLRRAFEQVKLAMQHGYEHLAKVEADADLGPLLEWPEFKALFRDWHARQEGN